ncbi:HNH endonuclease signature motif containing protein, partial [Planotetraspora thailandica]|uniref:HNH endonuclease signature motif containing protein n=1 Tax=Planotetraspora thailandica TaxID=487172 RepID=UPI0019504AA9
ARLKALLDAYAKPRSENDDRPRRQRNADAFAELLANKITTELVVLVNAESLPTDHPTTDHPTTDDGTANDVADDAADHDGGDIDGGPDDAVDPDDADCADDLIDRPFAEHAGDATEDVDAQADKTNEAAQTGEAGQADEADIAATHAGGMDGDDNRRFSLRATGKPSANGGDNSARRTRERSAQATSASRTHGRTGTGEQARDRLLRWKVPGLLLATGQLLSPTDIARLARTSTLMRLVMDADGQVLDMGRAVRLATGAQRKAVFARYGTCWIDGCPLPATLCQIDHADNWVEGGLTNLKLLGPACQHHNRDRYRHPERYLRRREGKDRWAYTYTGPRYRTRRRRTPTTGTTTTGPPRSGDPP